eukprot:523642_1
MSLNTDTFDLLQYLSQSATICALKSYNATQIKQRICAAYYQPKSKLNRIFDILLTMNSKQRNKILQTWTSDTGTNLLVAMQELFNTKYKKEKLATNLCISLFLNLPDLDAKWIYNALHSQQTINDTVIEIICTRTHSQLKTMTISYNNKFSTNLLREIRLKYKSDKNFVNIAENLLNGKRNENVKELSKREHLMEDAARIRNILSTKRITSNNLNALIFILTHRSWRYIHDLCLIYGELTGYNLLYALKIKLKKQICMPSNVAIITIVEVSCSIHAYFAKQLSLAFKTKNIRYFERIWLSRCEIDLGSIIELFSSKKALSDNRTCKRWLETSFYSKKIQPIYHEIILKVFGINIRNVGKYTDMYYNIDFGAVGSIQGIKNEEFNCNHDIRKIKKWIGSIENGTVNNNNALIEFKTKLTLLLCDRNASQRDIISNVFVKKYGKQIIHLLILTLGKNDPSLQMFDYLLKSINGCNITRLHTVIGRNDLYGICDMFCIHDAGKLNIMLRGYEKEYGINLMNELQDICRIEKQKTLFNFLSQLVSNKRRQIYNEFNDGKNVNISNLRNDVQFLLGLQSMKTMKWITKTERSQFLSIFALNGKPHLRALTDEFHEYSKHYTLSKLIDLVFFKVNDLYLVHSMKTIIQYTINQCEYFSNRIYNLGDINWIKYQDEINYIFVSRSEIDLYSIQLAFHNNLYGNGKILTHWVSEKTNQSKTGLFLVLLLQSLTKNKNSKQMTRDTLRAISASNYSNVYTPRHHNTIRNYDNTAPQAFFTPNSNGGSSLTLGIGFGELQLTKNIQSILHPKKSITQEFHIMNTYNNDNNNDNIVAVVNDNENNNRKKK